MNSEKMRDERMSTENGRTSFAKAMEDEE